MIICAADGCDEPRLEYLRGDQPIRLPLCRSHWAMKNGPTSPYKVGDTSILQGYVRVCVDVGGTRLWKAQHRVVMEEMLGRDLRPGESVHHVNGDRADNRPENLELWVGPMRSGVRAKDLRCPHCGEPYVDNGSGS